jgi:glycosyltransferase involved in cell wall biosynthesis
MRIGFDAKRAFNNTSGLGNYSRNTIRLLGNRYPDNQYLLYTPSINGSLDFSLPQGSSIEKPGSCPGKYCGPLWRSFGLSRRLINDRVELYHGLSHDLPLGMNNSPVKKVVTIHDMIAYRHPEMFTTVNRFIYQRKIAHSCRVADTIVAISKQTKADIEEFLNVDPSGINVIYQTCDPLFYKRAGEETRALVMAKYGLPQDFILSVGTIEPRKNLPSVIRAMQLGRIDIPLVVVGKKTGYFKTVMTLIQSAGIENVHFLENVPVEDRAAIYQQAMLFVYPSLYEGFGIPILEALSSGTPVITSSGSCFSETAGPESLYVDPSDNDELAEAIKKVIADPKLREKMIHGGLKYAGNFQHDTIAEKMMAVYESTVSSHK